MSTTFVKGPTDVDPTVSAVSLLGGITMLWVPVNTALNNIEMYKLYSIYPNPAVSSIFASGSDIKEVEICSLTGKQIISSKEQSVSISSLPKGFYLTVIYAKAGAVVKKIQKL